MKNQQITESSARKMITEAFRRKMAQESARHLAMKARRKNSKTDSIESREVAS